MWQVVTPPAVEAITLSEVKKHLRLDESDDSEDDWINENIEAARFRLERLLNRTLITTTYKLCFDRQPDYEIYLPRPPLQTVTNIKYLEEDGVEQTIDSGDYVVDNVSEPGRIIPDVDFNWPTTKEIVNSFYVTFKAGYGDAAANVEGWAKILLKQLVGHWYNNREISGDRRVEPIDLNWKSAIEAHSVKWFG